mmetsp:Transcript_68920/g.224605  ORF Transcript_68920/g.224605 Transcript_68920/m.224605 type:complete len:218 (-) Transcript_68920:2963-3616(-)
MPTMAWRACRGVPAAMTWRACRDGALVANSSGDTSASCAASPTRPLVTGHLSVFRRLCRIPRLAGEEGTRESAGVIKSGTPPCKPIDDVELSHMWLEGMGRARQCLLLSWSSRSGCRKCNCRCAFPRSQLPDDATSHARLKTGLTCTCCAMWSLLGNVRAPLGPPARNQPWRCRHRAHQNLSLLRPGVFCARLRVRPPARSRTSPRHHPNQSLCPSA